ncbi:phage terminase small subunit [Constrictibacter sp. MBR-5]|uniref:P27 family phage terminase small subunit n=1 Tax=Constrictibacter sp. MBR-5 TaxID=3156467 RepID=UPI00339796FB
MSIRRPKPPAHLSPAAAAWFARICREHDVRPGGEAILTLAAELLDRIAAARAALAEHGLVHVDRAGNPRPRPEIAIERDARRDLIALCDRLGIEQWEL